ncbi:hypothetical protein ACHHYP_00483 [Achlya hypogyna]|uniref:tRNA-splicing endonuclease subunit Sen15 domain-containing protein n=1 Tax=Achlya hypogyna TaxID=1202772 RepID=A0A1V9ZAN9_ACHHY|nr:hypothetical protein ACHHYP_00483 [Achlya hypogyna]
METVVAVGTPWVCESRLQWTKLLPLTPIYVYDIWSDLVQHKPMTNWSLLVDRSSAGEVYTILGELPIQVMHDGKRTRYTAAEAPVRVAVVCQSDVVECNLERLASVQSRLHASTPGLHSVYLSVANASQSIHYYVVRDCLT